MTLNIYPGMLDDSIEYFKDKEEVYIIRNGRISSFDELENHAELQEIIDNDSLLKSTLEKMCDNNKKQMQKKLASCRFGALNFTPDVGENVINSEYTDCDLRNSCIGCGIVCHNPIINGVEATPEEILLMQELCGNDKNSTIADKLGYKLGTFNVKKTKLYEKYNLITKQQLVKVMFNQGLL